MATQNEPARTSDDVRSALADELENLQKIGATSGLAFKCAANISAILAALRSAAPVSAPATIDTLLEQGDAKLLPQRIAALDRMHTQSTSHQERDALRAAMTALEQRTPPPRDIAVLQETVRECRSAWLEAVYPGSTIDELKNSDPAITGLADVLEAFLALNAPAVGVTREAIARLQEIVDLNSCGRYGRLAKEAIDLLGSPVPDATVSETVAWRWKYKNRPEMSWQYDTKQPQFVDSEAMICERLYTSPQHVGRDAAVSARDAVIEGSPEDIREQGFEPDTGRAALASPVKED